MKLGEYLAQTVLKLKQVGVETPKLDAELLAMAVFSLTKSEIAGQKDRILSEVEVAKLNKVFSLREGRMPVSRIVGERGFWKGVFKLNENTLDPRADSETLVEAVLRDFNSSDKLRILDLGTGSGCLLLSLLGDLKNAFGFGIDASFEAVKVAMENAKVSTLSDRVLFENMSWCDTEKLRKSEKFDIVISNPPYIPTVEIEKLQPEVKKYDPKLALDGGDDGLLAYRQIAAILPLVLDKAGFLYLEIGKGQGKDVECIFTQADAKLMREYKDYGGVVRVLKFGFNQA